MLFIKTLAFLIICFVISNAIFSFLGAAELIAIAFSDSYGILPFAAASLIHCFFGFSLISTFAPRVLELFYPER